MSDIKDRLGKGEGTWKRPEYSEEEIARFTRNRTMDQRGKLHIPEELKDPDLVYRFVNHNEKSSNVQRCLRLGYFIVEDKRLVGGDDGLSKGSQFGSAASRQVGYGVTGVLMAIPRYLYEQSEAKKKAKADHFDSVIGAGMKKYETSFKDET